MGAMANRILNLDEFQSNDALKLESRSPGTYIQQMEIQGNSLLSSIFVRNISVGATLKVNYFDTGVGTSEGERIDLDGHDLIDDTFAILGSDKIIVTKIHNKPVIEAIITGGTVDFGVYVSVVSDFATLIEAANPTTINKAVPLKDIETAQDLPNKTKKFMLRARGKSIIQLSFVASESGTKFITIPKGTNYSCKPENFTGTLYFQTSKDSEIVEIQAWA